jgi:hypothetical protein
MTPADEGIIWDTNMDRKPLRFQLSRVALWRWESAIAGAPCWCAVADERARSDRLILAQQEHRADRKPPHSDVGDGGEPQPFGRALQQLGVDAGKRYSPP